MTLLLKIILTALILPIIIIQPLVNNGFTRKDKLLLTIINTTTLVLIWFI